MSALVPKRPRGFYANALARTARGGPAPTWWLPSLVHLALADQELNTAAVRMLDGFERRRHEHCYVVVQEETDDHLSMTLTSWPMIDDQGRLRFITRTDPIEVHVERAEFQELIDLNRAVWRDVGLLPDALATSPVAVGDTFAMPFGVPGGATAWLDQLATRVDRFEHELVLRPDSEHPWRMTLESDSLPGVNYVCPSETLDTTPVIDITWDAREAGKVAYKAAFSGILDYKTDAEVLNDAISRALTSLEEDLAPDDTLALANEPAEPSAARRS